MPKNLFVLVLLFVFISSACAPAAAPQPIATSTDTPQHSPTAVRDAVEYTPTPQPVIDTPEWFDTSVLYEIFVRSYWDSDSNGVGDLAGLTTQLDYIGDLGVTAIWLMPIHPSPSYHGYDVTDYFDINPDYGTLDDWVTFVKAAHEREIHIVMDYVINHMSNEHPIFLDAYGNPDLQYANWFIWNDEQHTSYQAFGGFEYMPELNYDEPAVYDYVSEIARFWMDPNEDGDLSDGVDGFRADVAKDVPLEIWQRLRPELRAINPELLLLGEVWYGNAQNLVKWYDDAFDALFDYPLYHTIASSQDVNLDSVLAGVQQPQMINANILGADKLYPPGYQIVRFLNNHDNNRVMSEVGSDWERARAAATFNLMLPGTPMVYYGEEIGMLGEKGNGPSYWDEYRREPMDWYAPEEGEGMTTWFRPAERFNAPHDGISNEEQEAEALSLLNHYQTLIALRRGTQRFRLALSARLRSRKMMKYSPTPAMHPLPMEHRRSGSWF